MATLARRARALAPLFVLLSVGPCLGACNGRDTTVKGSGVTKTEARDVHGFTAITLEGTGELTFTQGAEESLTVEADDNVLPRITSTVSGGRLTLSTRGNITPSQPVRYRVTLRELTAIELSGSGRMTGRDIDARAVEVRLSGAGTVTLAGRADSEVVTLSGAGGYQAADLTVRAAKVSMDGVGSGVVHATDSLDVAIDGLGKLEYVGNPKITKTIDGLGSVKPR